MRLFHAIVAMMVTVLAAAPEAGATDPSGGRDPDRRGELQVRLTDVAGRPLGGRVVLRAEGRGAVTADVGEGRAELTGPDGAYEAYVHAYDDGVPILVAIRPVVLESGKPAALNVEVLEGAGGIRPLRAFDRDHDWALDRVELEAGTDPDDAASIPGIEPTPFNTRTLESAQGWYRGELHAHSSFGIGKESVSELVARAEKFGLDFLAITDRNTMAASRDPAFTSDKVVLIPALEWGSDEKGVALIYGPRTFPEIVATFAEAQATLYRVQAQGGVFVIAHPCFPTAPWRWGLSYVNAIEVWCRDWRAVGPMNLELLDEKHKERHKGRLVHSIALAANSAGHSANGQAALFWDYELVRGLKACAIGGSNTASPEVPMGHPVTYVWASEKSLPAILQAIRWGRTYISRSLDGPRLHFVADVLKDGRFDVSFGGAVPIGVNTMFEVGVMNAQGKKAEVLANGYPIIAKKIESDPFVFRFDITPDAYSVYRVRVIAAPGPEETGFGAVDVLAMSSPIYAQDLVPFNPQGAPDDVWIKIDKDQRDLNAPQPIAPPFDSPEASELIPQWQY